MGVIWTQKVRDELVEFVDRCTANGLTQKDAFIQFCRAKGPEYNEKSASVIYALAKQKEKGEGRRRIRRRPYDDEENRLIYLGTHFAPQFGLVRRDVLRLLAEKFNRTLGAIEQQASTLSREANIEIPEECPRDIFDILTEASEARIKRREERRRRRQEKKKQQSVAHQEKEGDDSGEVIDNVPDSTSIDVSTPTPRPTSPLIADVEPISPAEAEEVDIIDALSMFANATRQIEGINGEWLLKQLAVLATMAADHAEVGNLRNKNFQLTRRANNLEGQLRQAHREIEILTEKLVGFEKRFQEVKRQQETVEMFINEFAQLRNLDQITALKDISSKLKFESDRFGNVVRVVDEWREGFERQLIELYETDAATTKEVE